MQSHFELVVEDLDAARASLSDLGATGAGQPEPPDPHLTVMTDSASAPIAARRLHGL